MNGLQSLMQGASTQPTQPAPAMPAQNDPRMTAAMDVVDNDLDKLDLDPRTKALLKTQEAYDLVQSAQRELAMSQPQPMPPTIEGQRKMQTMEGIAGMLQRLRPGIQQRGQQVQRQQARQMLGGGMPSMGAPNMARMADGGIVGYQEGGLMSKLREVDTRLNAAADAAQNERMARGRRLSDYNILSKPYDAAMNIMYDTGIAGALQRLTGYESQLNKPEEKDPMAEQLKRFMALQDLYKARKAAGAEEEELRRIEQELASYSDVVRNIEADAARARSGMAAGGQVKGYAQGDLVESYDYLSDPNLYVPTEIAQPDEDILRFARERMMRDPEAEAIAAGERLRELTGVEDLMEQRRAAQAALQAQREARFSPEETRRRRISAGLAGLAERGLGGFGAGDIAEREKISGEKLSAAEASVADMDKLIGDLRDLGLSQFEAEKQARDMVERGKDQGLSTAQSIIASRRQAETAVADRESRERVAAMQTAATLESARRPTDFMNEIKIRVDALQAANPGLSDIDARSQALEERIENQTRAQLAAAGIRAETLEFEKLKTAYAAAADKLARRWDLMGNPDAYNAAFNAEVKAIMESLGASSTPTEAGTGTGAGTGVGTGAGLDTSSINPTAIRRLRENPTAEMRAFFDRAFGVGSAAAVLGQ